jgi:hypothetical protein
MKRMDTNEEDQLYSIYLKVLTNETPDDIKSFPIDKNNISI